jgi:hypothetical protein
MSSDGDAVRMRPGGDLKRGEKVTRGLKLAVTLISK